MTESGEPVDMTDLTRVASVTEDGPQLDVKPSAVSEADEAVRERGVQHHDLGVYYGDVPGGPRHQPADLEERDHRADRSVRLRQDHLPPVPEPHERPDRGARASRARSCYHGGRPLRRATSTRSRSGGASAWCSRSRTRSPKSIYDNIAFGPKIAGYQGRTWTSSSRSALRKAALWDEVKDKLKELGDSRSRAASSSGCASRGRSPSEPDVILMDEPCSALDPIATREDRRPDAGAGSRLHDRDRDAQHAAGARVSATGPRSSRSTSYDDGSRTGRWSSSTAPRRSSRTPRPADRGLRHGDGSADAGDGKKFHEALDAIGDGPAPAWASWPRTSVQDAVEALVTARRRHGARGDRRRRRDRRAVPRRSIRRRAVSCWPCSRRWRRTCGWSPRCCTRACTWSGSATRRSTSRSSTCAAGATARQRRPCASRSARWATIVRAHGAHRHGRVRAAATSTLCLHAPDDGRPGGPAQPRHAPGGRSKLADDPRALDWGLHMNIAARALERVGDNAVDIGEQVEFLLTGEFREFTDASHPVDEVDEGS